VLYLVIVQVQLFEDGQMMKNFGTQVGNEILSKAEFLQVAGKAGKVKARK
jgi:hypothetical protein